MMTSAHEIQHVLTGHPDLGSFGFGSSRPAIGDDFLQQVSTARRWLNETPAVSRLVERRGSYAIKHMIERASGMYISTGAAIIAMSLEGFAPVRSRHAGPNCLFRRT